MLGCSCKHTTAPHSVGCRSGARHWSYRVCKWLTTTSCIAQLVKFFRAHARQNLSMMGASARQQEQTFAVQVGMKRSIRDRSHQH